MKYLCLVYFGEMEHTELSQNAWDALNARGIAYREAIANSGHGLAGETLESTQTATTVRVRDGKMSTAHGAFAETKEQLGAFYYIEARDLNEAIQLASNIPSAELGSIEVRPVRSLIRNSIPSSK